MYESQKDAYSTGMSPITTNQGAMFNKARISEMIVPVNKPLAQKDSNETNSVKMNFITNNIGNSPMTGQSKTSTPDVVIIPEED